MPNLRKGRTLKWIEPQLTRLVGEPPTGPAWVHEVKYDGYGMHARIGGPRWRAPRTAAHYLRRRSGDGLGLCSAESATALRLSRGSSKKAELKHQAVLSDRG